MGRPKKGEEPKKTTAKKEAKTSKASVSKKRNTKTLTTLAEIENKLLKKAKANGDCIDQDEIYDALSQYELDDEVIEDLIKYFADHDIEVLSSDEDEDEDLDAEEDEEFDESKISLEDDDDDFYEDLIQKLYKPAKKPTVGEVITQQELPFEVTPAPEPEPAVEEPVVKEPKVEETPEPEPEKEPVMMPESPTVSRWKSWLNNIVKEVTE